MPVLLEKTIEKINIINICMCTSEFGGLTKKVCSGYFLRGFFSLHNFEKYCVYAKVGSMPNISILCQPTALAVRREEGDRCQGHPYDGGSRVGSQNRMSAHSKKNFKK